MRSARPTILSRSLPRFSDRVTALPMSARYAVAVVVASAGVVLRLALDPLWGTTLPFITLFPAVMLSAWLGGFWPGIVATAVSVAAAGYFWIPPARTWSMPEAGDWLGLITFAAIGVVFSALNESWRRSARALAESEQRLAVTLASIGDAVLTTDSDGRIAQLNAVAERLTGWTAQEAAGRPLDDVFVIVNEHTREPAENPVRRALRDGITSGLANHTVLVARDGRTTPIEDSAAPIRSGGGSTLGAVMVFRDVTERRLLENERDAQGRSLRELAAIVESSDDAIVSKDRSSSFFTPCSADNGCAPHTRTTSATANVTIIVEFARKPQSNNGAL